MKKSKKQTSWRRTLYILFFSQLVVAVGFSSIYPFLPLYVKQLGSSRGISIELLAGLVYSTQAFASMIASPIWGTVADRFGRKLMIQRSMFGGAIILLLMSYVQSAEQLVLLRTIQGLITGTMSASLALLASVTPREESGFAMGLLQVGYSVGLSLGPLLGGATADMFGYSTAFYITAIFLLLGALLVTFGVRENFTPEINNDARKLNLMDNWGRFLVLPGVLMTYVMRFITSMGWAVTTPIIPLHVQELLGNSTSVNTFTGLVMGITSGATMFSAVFLGKLGDRMGYRKVLVVSMTALIVGYPLQGFVTKGWQFLGLQALIGLAFGGVIPIISALLTNYIRIGDEGSAFGLDNSVTAAGRGMAPLFGAFVATTWGYPITFVATGLIFALAVILAVWRLPPSRLIKG